MKQNEKALENAVRDEGYIKYDPKYPLIINKDTKILEIVRKTEEVSKLLPDEDGIYEEFLQTEFSNEVSIVFLEKDGRVRRGNKPPYTISIFTSEPLEEVEKKLLECEDENDIELIEEEL